MTLTISQGVTTISPDAYLNYEAESAAHTRVHTVLGASEPDITGRPSALRAGRIELLFNDEEPAAAAEVAFRGGGVWSLASDVRSSLAMQFVVSGQIVRRLEIDRGYKWVVEVGWQEVSAAAGTSRYTIAYTTEEIADGAQETGFIPMWSTFRVIRVTFSHSGRARLYDNEAHRDADLARERGTDPSIGAGVMLDVALEDAGALTMSPVVTVAVDAGAWAPITVDNLSGSPAAVTVTFLYERAV